MWRSSKERRNVKTKKKRGQPCESEEGREEWVRERGGGGRNHRADSACLCFHFPPQDRRSRGRQREEWEKRERGPERGRDGKLLSADMSVNVSN